MAPNINIPELLVSGTMYLPSIEAALEAGIPGELIRQSRGSSSHALVELGSSRIVEHDWRKRQQQFDEALAPILARAKQFPGDSNTERSFVVRVGMDPGQGQLSFAFPAGFLMAWGELGGSIAIDG